MGFQAFDRSVDLALVLVCALWAMIHSRFSLHFLAQSRFVLDSLDCSRLFDLILQVIFNLALIVFCGIVLLVFLHRC